MVFLDIPETGNKNNTRHSLSFECLKSPSVISSYIWDGIEIITCLDYLDEILTETGDANKLFSLRPLKNMRFFKDSNLNKSCVCAIFNFHIQNSLSPIGGVCFEKQPPHMGVVCEVGVLLIQSNLHSKNFGTDPKSRFQLSRFLIVCFTGFHIKITQNLGLIFL